MNEIVSAIVRTGNKQYWVKPDDVLEVERLPKKPGASVSLDKVLVLRKPGEMMVGQPTVKNAAVVCEVLEHVRGKKVIAFKFRHRESYRRKKGHRQALTRLKVKEIVLKGD
jgi:large subunit ribosomal protein L21